jgi:uncharacterized protein YndB with AHSA1/START domain
MTDHVATAEVAISASPAQVWAALTDPVQLKKWMFGADVESAWTRGSPIVWRGEYEQGTYEDRGEVLDVDPPHHLRMTHFSPSGGMDDVPENYHHVSYDLEERGDRTYVTLRQDNNSSEEEAERSAANWSLMLHSLKEVVERG